MKKLSLTIAFLLAATSFTTVWAGDQKPYIVKNGQVWSATEAWKPNTTKSTQTSLPSLDPSSISPSSITGLGFWAFVGLIVWAAAAQGTGGGEA